MKYRLLKDAKKFLILDCNHIGRKRNHLTYAGRVSRSPILISILSIFRFSDFDHNPVSLLSSGKCNIVDQNSQITFID